MLLKVVLAEDLYDYEFVADNVIGLEDLRRGGPLHARFGGKGRLGRRRRDDLIKAARVFGVAPKRLRIS